MRAFKVFLTKKMRWAAPLAIAGTLGGGAMVLAAIPDSSGVIHGCRNNNNGSLKIIDDATQTCSSSETAINWNQTGPQGPTGPQGATGPAGPAGGAVAYARINTDGTLNTADSLNITSFSRLSSYDRNIDGDNNSAEDCFTVNATLHGVIVSPERPVTAMMASIDPNAFPTNDPSNDLASCPTGTNAVVTNGTPGFMEPYVASGYYLLFY